METPLESRKIEVGPEGLAHLNTTRKWTMFLAILGFVFLGLMLIIGVTAGSLVKGMLSGLSGMQGMEGMEGMEGVDVAGAAGGLAGGLMIFFILIFAVIYFFPLFYLLKYSSHSKKAVETLDANELTLALKFMKKYWVYMGILIIVLLAIYLLLFIVAGASMAMLSGIK
ncbi:MAG: hypothetical protein U0X39_00440 [Bacteroidales bacterium]